MDDIMASWRKGGTRHADYERAGRAQTGDL